MLKKTKIKSFNVLDQINKDPVRGKLDWENQWARKWRKSWENFVEVEKELLWCWNLKNEYASEQKTRTNLCRSTVAFQTLHSVIAQIVFFLKWNHTAPRYMHMYIYTIVETNQIKINLFFVVREKVEERVIVAG